jgi:hypothetical protein
MYDSAAAELFDALTAAERHQLASLLHRLQEAADADPAVSPRDLADLGSHQR